MSKLPSRRSQDVFCTEKDGNTRFHGKIAQPLSPDMNPIEHTWNMLGRSSSGARMHPRYDESALVRHRRMTRHTARRSSASFWKLCGPLLLRRWKIENPSCRILNAFQATKYDLLGYILQRTFFHFYHKLFAMFVS